MVGEEGDELARAADEAASVDLGSCHGEVASLTHERRCVRSDVKGAVFLTPYNGVTHPYLDCTFVGSDQSWHGVGVSCCLGVYRGGESVWKQPPRGLTPAPPVNDLGYYWMPVMAPDHAGARWIIVPYWYELES